VKQNKPFSNQLFILTWSVIALTGVSFLTRGSLSFAQDCSNRATSPTNFDSLAYKSTDGGASWKTVVDVNADFLAHQANKIVVDPSKPSNIYMGTNNGVFKSSNGGCSWRDSSAGLSERYIRDLVIDLKTPSNLYALTSKDSGNVYRVPPSNKVFISVDGGNDWRAASFDYDINCLAVDPSNPTTVYLGASNQEAVGIYKSTDSGRTFAFIKQRDKALGLSIKYIVVDPKNSSTLYYGSNMPGESNALGGLYKSTDGGITFEVIRHPDDFTFTMSLVVDQQNTSTLYEVSSRGLFRSTDGGGEWAGILYKGFPLVAETLLIDPAHNLYAEFSLPVGNNSPFPTLELIKSTDEGQTWSSNRWTGSISSIAFDPLDPSIVYDRGFVPVPEITATAIIGKKLIVTGSRFHEGVVLILNGNLQSTKLRPLAETGLVQLISKKAAKNVAAGQIVTVNVQEADGVVVSAWAFRPN
jgi:photosystem II stability/assembly factor-like uncharacterized protein